MAGTNPSEMLKILADIFSKMDATRRDQMLDELIERDPTAARHIRDLMFTFDDLQHVAPPGLQMVLRNVEPQTLAVALMGASREMTRAFFENMSARAAMMVKEDMDALPNVRQTDVNVAQAEIATIAQELATAGTIRIVGKNDGYLR